MQVPTCFSCTSTLGIPVRPGHVLLWGRSCKVAGQNFANVRRGSIRKFLLRLHASNGNGIHGAPQLRTSLDVEVARLEFEKKLQEPEKDDKLWLAAIKPTMYSVAYVPILVAAGLAYYVSGTASIARLLQLCLGSTFIIAWLNTSNDAFDAFTGVDSDQRKPESLVNLTGNRTAVLILAHVFLTLGATLLWGTVRSVGDSRVGMYLAAAVALGYLYQGPPFRLSYHGLGEILCFFAFGPLATSAFFLAQLPAGFSVGAIPAVCWAASCLVGITTSLILLCSHFHQVEGDQKAGKKSPVVRMGTQTAAEVLRMVVLSVYLLTAVCCSNGWLPSTTIPIALGFAAPKAVELCMFAHTNHWSPPAIKPLKFVAINWHVQVGVALAAGIALARHAAIS